MDDKEQYKEKGKLEKEKTQVCWLARARDKYKHTMHVLKILFSVFFILATGVFVLILFSLHL